MKQLDPKAVWLFFFSHLTGMLILLIPFFFISQFVFRELIADFKEENIQLPLILLLLLENLWVIILLLISAGYLWAKLTYNNYKYELSSNGFKKESGIIWKSYVTIPYERIQNVDIYRGVWARILGLSDLQIQTAGMSAIVGRGAMGAGSEGRLPALSKEEAEKLRDELVNKASGKKGI